jgi:hypothetical protein
MAPTLFRYQIWFLQEQNLAGWTLDSRFIVGLKMAV